MMEVCAKSSALADWLTPESLKDIADFLESCDSAEALGELRRLTPREALMEASRQISPGAKKRIRTWVEQLNSQQSCTNQIQSNSIK